jgi:predicted protein tyrosine phosphatase
VHYQQEDRLFISSLPSLIELERFNNIRNVQHLVNVAGVNIKDIYSESDLSDFNILQFDFADVFTNGSLVTDFSNDEKHYDNLYESASEPHHRFAYLEAVKALKSLLENEKPALVFCHRGLSRSPLVTASALNLLHKEKVSQSISRVHAIHPSAQFTNIGISALLWTKGQLT